MLVAHCIRCHGDEKQEGNLALSSMAVLIQGGESGPTIVAGKPNESLILEALRHESLEMPPDSQLDTEVIEGIEKWIAAGAPWPEDVVLKSPPKLTEEDREWWCYQPINDPKPPVLTESDWCRSEIDYFILKKLSEKDLTPAHEADPVTLARRVHFAITGLPPDDATIAAALSGDFDYEALVDRLLESKSYGANQSRFWLDLVRYAETDGYRADAGRPEAHYYRDYVIDSFNDDKPYDRFIREQIAGDEIDPGNREALIGTMYLRHWIYEHNNRDVENQWHEILSDITETTSDVFLAQGLKCARCHDHKFDPLLQKDFFRFKAFFAAFQPSEDHPIADVPTRKTYQEKFAAWEAATADIRQRLHEIEFPVLLKHATREGFDKFIPEIQTMIRKRVHQREPYEHQIASLASRQFDLPYEKLDQWLSDEAKVERQTLLAKLAEFDAIKPAPLPTMNFVGSDVGPVAPVTYITDDKDQKPIAPGFLTLLDPSDAQVTPMPEPLRSTGRRTALADWIASEQNPLTARVFVNRVWQQHFGRGLVETSSDFGRLGIPPSHPALLDWLASRFMEDGWSVKKLHRRILTSATYRQTSLRPIDDSVREIDPENRLLWRMNPRRLSGEEFTDAVLMASGEIERTRRAIYKPVKRNSPDPLLAAFDAPDRIRSVGKRHRTTTSTQSLLLANGGWARDRAAAIAKRFRSEDAETFVEKLYLSLFGRSSSRDEVLMATAFLNQYASETPVDSLPDSEKLAEMPGTKANGTNANAVDLKPGAPIAICLPASDMLPDEDFTIEAVVMLRSLYPNADVRTVVAHWNGNQNSPGWSLGVTSTKSAYQPRNLILQLVGKTEDGDKLHYEVVASNLRPELNKPYYLAARVKLSDTSDQGITFYLKDLSDKDAKLQTAQATHSVTHGLRSVHDLTVGGRSDKHQWDGLIDSIRLESKPRDLAKLAQADSPEGLPQYLIDWRFENPENIGLDSSGHGNHALAKTAAPNHQTPHDHARVALVHALLNSNELIYVD
ncbi:Planctomycete cytochrome C [Neorhodopirellula pilleata]|uniref:Planctomycete cytochrome C n=2 Tax=Neorhodopirellula pilleata TaxID=2714738 RepID=A0A5C5ZH24_9BACT|nr:Planctomycete cytochrome C [Neorhodopirellula pilleata]